MHLIQGALLAADGLDLGDVARAVGTTKARLQAITSSSDPIEAVIGVGPGDLSEDDLQKVRRKVGELVLGKAAEIAFEEICRAGIDPTKFTLKDMRQGRTNTDYRLFDGSHALFRLNVKFFGSVFRRGVEMVHLAPSDCFPLATYKIHAALQEQEKEHLPYVFAVVGVPDLNAKAIADAIPEQDVMPTALLSASAVVPRKRDFEDDFVDRIVQAKSPAFTRAYSRIREAEWYVLSARRADRLLHQMLYERVYALRVPGFTHQFGGAEVDMHFSLSGDLVTLQEVLRVLREEGPGKVTTMLERGTY